MQLPFTAEQFHEVFKNYNESVFPLQVLFYVMGILILLPLYKKSRQTDIVISSILGFFWIWTGIFYHLIFFAAINKAAYAFGIFFIIQGVLFIVYGLRKKLVFKYSNSLLNNTGLLLIGYALIIYPVLGIMSGRFYPYSITLGLPCPTVIFTFGMLLLTKDRISMVLLIIPLLWSVLGLSAALNFGVYEDIGLIISGAAGFLLLSWRNYNLKRPVLN